MGQSVRTQYPECVFMYPGLLCLSRGLMFFTAEFDRPKLLQNEKQFYLYTVSVETMASDREREEERSKTIVSAPWHDVRGESHMASLF